jgi:hypothetical protein
MPHGSGQPGPQAAFLRGYARRDWCQVIGSHPRTLRARRFSIATRARILALSCDGVRGGAPQGDGEGDEHSLARNDLARPGCDCGWRCERHSGGTVRHWRRCRHCPGTLRGLSNSRCARGCSHAALHRHIAGDHGADICPLVPRAPLQRGGHPRRCSGVVPVSRCRRRCGIPCGSKSARGTFQSCICRLRQRDWPEDGVRQRLANPFEPARARSKSRVWVSDWPRFLTGRRKWWVGFERRPDAVRPADTARSCHLGRHWRADHDRGNDRICVGRLAPHASPASVVSRFCVFARLGADGAGIELYGFLWSENGASLVEAAARNCLWDISAPCVGEIYCKPAVSVCWAPAGTMTLDSDNTKSMRGRGRDIANRPHARLL